MEAARAQAFVPGLVMREAEPEADARALEALAVWALRYAPIAAADAPDGLVIDISGAAHLFGGEAAMTRDMIERLAARGVAARAAVADAWGAAHALARYGERRAIIAALGEQAEALRPLPLVALRLPVETVAALNGLGFERIGDLVAAPRAPLALRFGEALTLRLDQALGRRAEPIEPARTAETPQVKRGFGEPIAAAETIARYVALLCDSLCAALEERGLGARRLDLICRRIDGAPQAVRISLARPMRDAARMTRLIAERIVTIDPGFGIEAMSLAATKAEPLGAAQARFVEEAPPDPGPLVDVLANRLGEEKIYRLAPEPSEVPERSVRRLPPLAAGGASSREVWREVWPERWPRPARLLPRPEPIEAIAVLPDHPPRFFVWRGARRGVARADGPERIFGEWRKRDAELHAVRDYFRVEDEKGARYWIFRSGDGEDASTGSGAWFLHGFFA